MVVSIHAPRVGGDVATCGSGLSRRSFNPRPPRGGRPPVSATPTGWTAFQSTPPAWGATSRRSFLVGRKPCFNPRPPRGGRPHSEMGLAHADRFNPRPPRGGRRTRKAQQSRLPGFNPRPPRGGRQRRNHLEVGFWLVSIHAPRVGGDLRVSRQPLHAESFNPRPPRGGRHYRSYISNSMVRFNPRPPRGGRLLACRIRHVYNDVSIHAPRVGGDVPFPSSRQSEWFQSTPPAWGATLLPLPALSPLKRFNPRPPRGGRRKLGA